MIEGNGVWVWLSLSTHNIEVHLCWKKEVKKKIFCISETGDNVDIVVIIGIVFVIV